jgi:hypothetical protein
MKNHDTRSPAALTGYISAVPTPFRDCGQAIDENAFSAFCAWQIERGIAALAVCGTTGEAPTLTDHEQHRLVRLAIKAANGRVPVIAGAGSNSTAHAVELARAAQGAGADMVLGVVPYYNKPSQEGLYRHFRSIAEAVEIPIILYDVPSRTGCALGHRDDRPARRAAARRRAQGCDRRPRAAGPSAPPARPRVPPLQRRRRERARLSRPGRRRLHLGHV